MLNYLKRLIIIKEYFLGVHDTSRIKERKNAQRTSAVHVAQRNPTVQIAKEELGFRKAQGLSEAFK